MASTQQTGTDPTEEITDAVVGAEGTVYVLEPTPDVLRHLVTRLDETSIDGPRAVVVTGQTNPYRVAFGDFAPGSLAAELIERGRLKTVVAEDIEQRGKPLVVGPEEVTVPVSAGGATELVVDRGEAVVEQIVADARAATEGGTEYTPRFPPRRPAFESFEEALGDDDDATPTVDRTADREPTPTARDAEDGPVVVSRVMNPRRAREDLSTFVDAGLGIAEAAVLAGARHGAMLIHVRRWGDTSGVISSATISRTKNRLEEADIVATVGVPAEIGRPRQLLGLTEEWGEATTTELAEAARDAGG